MFSSTQPVSFEYLPDHLVSQAAKSRRASMRSRRSPGSGFAGPRTGSQPAQLLQTVVVDPARDVVERVAQKMDVATLIGRLRQSFAQRCLQRKSAGRDRQVTRSVDFLHHSVDEVVENPEFAVRRRTKCGRGRYLLQPF
jgi:hypothetical protein